MYPVEVALKRLHTGRTYRIILDGFRGGVGWVRRPFVLVQHYALVRGGTRDLYRVKGGTS